MKFLFRARWSLVSLHFGIQSLWHGWRIRTRRIQEFSKCSSGTLESGQSSRREWCFRQACTCTCFKLVCKSILLCNPARFACLSRTHKWKKKKKKKRKEWKNIFLLATPLPLLRRNHKSLFTISARLSSFSYVSQRKYWISMNMISKDINFENARGYLTYIRYSRFVSYKNISHKKHNLTIIFQ